MNGTLCVCYESNIKEKSLIGCVCYGNESAQQSTVYAIYFVSLIFRESRLQDIFVSG